MRCFSSLPVWRRLRDANDILITEQELTPPPMHLLAARTFSRETRLGLQN